MTVDTNNVALKERSPGQDKEHRALPVMKVYLDQPNNGGRAQRKEITHTPENTYLHIIVVVSSEYRSEQNRN